MSVSYLIYTSTANELLTLNELESLWVQAKNNNLKTNISGLLLYQEGIFMQMLEGQQNDLLDLYDKIQNDPRHTCEQQPLIGDIPERFFPDWSMGFKQLEQNSDLPSLKNFVSYIDSLFVNFDKDKVDEILNFIFSYSGWSKSTDLD